MLHGRAMELFFIINNDNHYQYIIPLVIAGDWIAKTVFAPVELSVGIVLSIIGELCFLCLSL